MLVAAVGEWSRGWFAAIVHVADDMVVLYQERFFVARSTMQDNS